MEIIIKKEGDGYCALMSDNPDDYSWGRSIAEAYGNLLKGHLEELNIKIKIEI